MSEERMNILRKRSELPESFYVLHWQPIDTAPKDKPILGWCVHKADPYYEEGGDRLTIYGAHAEGLGAVPDGPHVLEWGGEYSEDDWTIPNWWFRYGSDFLEVANPTHWMPMPDPPESENGKKE